MAFTTAVWEVTRSKLAPLSRKKLDTEKRLEDWLAQDLGLLGRELLLIGRQIPTHAGRIDLLALDENGVVVVIELKKDKTPREVVAQVLDYGSWVSKRDFDEINRLILARQAKSLSQAFREAFDTELPEDACTDHELVIVASELDDASERIVNYLADVHELGINVVFFNVFELDGKEIVTRSWLADPEEVEERREQKTKRPWSGLCFVNVGMDHPEDPQDKNGRPNSRHWENCRKYGYVSAGGGPRWSRALHKLQVGDKVMAYVKKAGYVGYGEVSQQAAPIHEFRLSDGRTLGKRLDFKQNEHVDDWEHAVGVTWHKTFPISDAKWFQGAFAKPPVVCRIRDPQTAAFLSKEFGI